MTFNSVLQWDDSVLGTFASSHVATTDVASRPPMDSTLFSASDVLPVAVVVVGASRFSHSDAMRR